MLSKTVLNQSQQAKELNESIEYSEYKVSDSLTKFTAYKMK